MAAFSASLRLQAYKCAFFACFALSFLTLSLPVSASQPQSFDFIFKLKSPNTAAQTPQDLQAQTQSWLQPASPLLKVLSIRPMALPGMYAVRLTSPADVFTQDSLLGRLSGLTQLAWVESDIKIRRVANRVPNDSMYTQQAPYLGMPGNGTFGIAMPSAWGQFTGNASIVIALLDSGVLFGHPELKGRLLPGYDFVSDLASAGDGDGRDPDASDPGDGKTSAYINSQGGACSGALPSDSSWHGTSNAGIIGGLSDNGAGVAGIDWQAKVLPLRVTGKCDGALSDLIDAMAWAVGMDVPNVPANKTPARVLNISLGANVSCPLSLQAAVTQVLAKGAVISAAAGNNNGAVSAPANCAGAGLLAVGALNYAGNKASYSNLGAGVDISAPVGSSASEGVFAPSNSGTLGPQAMGYARLFGTSFSTPMVSAVAALLLGAQPSLTPAEVENLIKKNAMAFPSVAGKSSCTAFSLFRDSECNCTTTTCGAGILNAGAALKGLLADRPGLSLDASKVVGPSSSQTVRFMSDVPSGAVVGWRQTDGPALQLAEAGPGAISFTAPAVSSAVRIAAKVTDAAGRSTEASYALYVANPDVSPQQAVFVPTPSTGGTGTPGQASGSTSSASSPVPVTASQTSAQSGSSGSGGGGGAVGLVYLLGWLAVVALRPRRV